MTPISIIFNPAQVTAVLMCEALFIASFYTMLRPQSERIAMLPLSHPLQTFTTAL